MDGEVAGTVVQVGVVRGGISVERPVSPRPTPQLLPARNSHFVGRQSELSTLDALIGHTGEGARSSTVVISAIHGTAGIGKTALALTWAHGVAEFFPDGQLYADLRGFDRQTSVEPAQVLHGFLIALGVAPEAIPLEVDAKAGLYRSLLATRRMLLVLDNVRDSEHVRALLPGSSSCVVLVTSRSSLDSLIIREGAQRLILDLLSPDEAVALIADRIGHGRVEDEHAAAVQLSERCARLPLALGIAAARIAAQPNLGLARLAAELENENERLNALNLGDADLDLRAVFSWSYRALSAEAQKLFRLLSVHPGPDIALPAAASLVALPAHQTRTTLAELTRAHLLDEPTPGRYRFHDLLRAYASEQAAMTDAGLRHEALRRTLDHYLHNSWAAEKCLYPYREAVLLEPLSPGVELVRIVSYQDALTWFAQERPVLISATRAAISRGFYRHAMQLPWALVTFFGRRGHWRDNANCLQIAASAAEQLNDLSGKAMNSRFLGRAYTLLERYAEAIAEYSSAIGLLRKLGNSDGEARTHRSLSLAYQSLHQYDKGGEHALIAMEIFRLTGNKDGEARALHCLGWCSAWLANYGEAAAYFTDAIELFKGLERPDTQGQASAVDGLGFTYHQLGEYAAAIDRYEQALLLWREVGNTYFAADTFARMGESHNAAGDAEAARTAYGQAIEIFDSLNHRNAEQVRAMLGDLG
jgi:tetratricopeptide (TPR) repeat protein